MHDYEDERKDSQSVSLLKNIYYGYEVERLPEATTHLESLINRHFNRPSHKRVDSIDDMLASTKLFFDIKVDGVFGGQITYGDCIFLASIMKAISPTRMIEFGVASGFSSAFILWTARHLNLLTDSCFLYSFDIDDGRLSGNVVGHIVNDYFEQLMPYWKCNLGKSSLDLLKDSSFAGVFENVETLAFVDGGHNHPWPAVDLLVLYKVIGRKSWVLLQDIRMMERWILDCIKFNVPSPVTVRGVEHAFSFWPGKKFSGLNICYNMAAISLDVSKDDIVSFFSEILKYDFEIDFSREHIQDLFQLYK